LPSDEQLAPRERKISALLKSDEATHIDEMVERLEANCRPRKPSPRCASTEANIAETELPQRRWTGKTLADCDGIIP